MGAISRNEKRSNGTVERLIDQASIANDTQSTLIGVHQDSFLETCFRAHDARNNGAKTLAVRHTVKRSKTLLWANCLPTLRVIDEGQGHR
jgi:hypothetical protein